MNDYLFPIYAVAVGVFFVWSTKGKKVKLTSVLLSFSGAFLLALTLYELLPEVYHHLEAKKAGLYIMSGILLQIILEFFSKGAEHGHIHIKKNQNKFPWLLFISLCIHSFLEGFPIHHHNDMIYGVIVHKMPIAALIYTFLIKSNYKPYHIILFLLVFSIMTPLGTLVAHTADVSLELINCINAVVIGIFLHVSTTIIFETGEGHKFTLSKLAAILFGIVAAFFL